MVLNNADYLSKLLSDIFNFNFSSPGLLGVDSVVGDSRPISVNPCVVIRNFSSSGPVSRSE